MIDDKIKPALLGFTPFDVGDVIYSQTSKKIHIVRAVDDDFLPTVQRFASRNKPGVDPELIRLLMKLQSSDSQNVKWNKKELQEKDCVCVLPRFDKLQFKNKETLVDNETDAKDGTR